MAELVARYRDSGDKRYLHEAYSTEAYFKVRERIKPEWLRKSLLMAQMMRPLEGLRVLDVGCATKSLQPFVEEKGALYTGLDISPRFDPDIVADAEDMSMIPDDSFDWVVMADVLEHLPHPHRAIAEAHRVGQRCLAVVPCLYHLQALTFLPRPRWDKHLVCLPPGRWLALFQAAGFHISQWRGFYFVPSIAFYPVRLLTRVDKYFFGSPPFRWLDRLIERHTAGGGIFRYLGQEIIIVAERSQAEPASVRLA